MQAYGFDIYPTGGPSTEYPGTPEEPEEQTKDEKYGYWFYLEGHRTTGSRKPPRKVESPLYVTSEPYGPYCTQDAPAEGASCPQGQRCCPVDFRCNTEYG